MVHPHGCDCEAYACQLRAKGVSVSPKATPTQHNRKAPAPHTNNNWEKGVAGENRGRGTFMPYLGQDGKPLPIKQRSEAESKVKKLRERLQASTT
jgi:hypothetical protein